MQSPTIFTVVSGIVGQTDTRVRAKVVDTSTTIHTWVPSTLVDV